LEARRREEIPRKNEHQDFYLCLDNGIGLVLCCFGFIPDPQQKQASIHERKDFR